MRGKRNFIADLRRFRFNRYIHAVALLRVIRRFVRGIRRIDIQRAAFLVDHNAVFIRDRAAGAFGVQIHFGFNLFKLFQNARAAHQLLHGRIAHDIAIISGIIAARYAVARVALDRIDAVFIHRFNDAHVLCAIGMLARPIKEYDVARLRIGFAALLINFQRLHRRTPMFAARIAGHILRGDFRIFQAERYEHRAPIRIAGAVPRAIARIAVPLAFIVDFKIALAFAIADLRLRDCNNILAPIAGKLCAAHGLCPLRAGFLLAIGNRHRAARRFRFARRIHNADFNRIIAIFGRRIFKHGFARFAKVHILFVHNAVQRNRKMHIIRRKSARDIESIIHGPFIRDRIALLRPHVQRKFAIDHDNRISGFHGLRFIARRQNDGIPSGSGGRIFDSMLRGFAFRHARIGIVVYFIGYFFDMFAFKSPYDGAAQRDLAACVQRAQMRRDRFGRFRRDFRSGIHRRFHGRFCGGFRSGLNRCRRGGFCGGFHGRNRRDFRRRFRGGFRSGLRGGFRCRFRSGLRRVFRLRFRSGFHSRFCRSLHGRFRRDLRSGLRRSIRYRGGRFYHLVCRDRRRIRKDFLRKDCIRDAYIARQKHAR